MAPPFTLSGEHAAHVGAIYQIARQIAPGAMVWRPCDRPSARRFCMVCLRNVSGFVMLRGAKVKNCHEEVRQTKAKKHRGLDVPVSKEGLGKERK